MQPRVIVFTQATGIDVDNLFKRGRLLRDRQQLIDLLLIPDHCKPGSTVVDDVGDLISDRVLIDRHRDSADVLRCDHGPVEGRPITPGNRDGVPDLDPHVQKTRGQIQHLLMRLGPGPALPDPEFLLPVGHPCRKARCIAPERARQGALVIS